MVLQSGANDAETNGENDQRGDPEGVQPAFRLPYALFPCATDPQRNAIVAEVAPEFGCEEANPEGEDDWMALAMSQGDKSNIQKAFR